MFAFERNDIMVTKENKLEKTCSFYVSEYHLEMILVPYINKKIEEKYNVEIITQKNLKDTVKTLMDKINLEEQRKNKILNLNWGESKDFYEIKNKEKQIIIVNGNKEYIEQINKQIENIEENDKLEIVNCYNLEEIGENIGEIRKQYKNILNTTGIEKQYD